MIKTIHIKLLLLFSLSILFGHSSFAQNIGDTPPTEQHVCVGANVNYTVFGFPGSTIKWYVDGAELTQVVELNNSGNNVGSNPVYQKGILNYTWDVNNYPPKVIAYPFQIKEFSVNCESDLKNLNIYVHRKPTVNATVTPVSCNGSSNGKITINNTTPPFTPSSNFNVIQEFSLDGVNYEAVSEFDGLVSGNYTLYYRYTYNDNSTVWIVGGSSGEIGVIISEPTVISIAHETTDISCVANSDGAIDLTVSGGESVALSFKGTSEGVNLTAAQRMDNIDGFTVEGWVKFNSSNTYASSGYSLFGQNNLIEFSINSSGFYAWVKTSSTSFNTTHPFNNATLNDDQWHHLALTGSKTELILYVDGVEVKNKPVSLGTDHYSSGYPLDNPSVGTGVSSGGTSNPFDGEISSVRFWTVERTATEVKSGMNQRMTGSESGLMAAYRLDEGNGNTISGVGNNNTPDLTLPSGVTWQTNELIYSYSWTGPGSFTATSKDLSDLSSGIYQVTVSNSNGCTINDNNIVVGVKPDDEDPVISNCPSDITVGACANTVTWTAPIATDNCSVTLTSAHNSGDVFPIGITTLVTYTATDGAGNTALCSFDVTVLPEITVIITADNNPICDGEPVTITANGGGGKLPYAYEFYLNGTLIVSNASYAVSGNQLLSSVFTNGDEVTVKIIDNNTCEKTSNKIIMTVNGLPLPQDIEHN